jgi:hypothetical protein
METNNCPLSEIGDVFARVEQIRGIGGPFEEWRRRRRGFTEVSFIAIHHLDGEMEKENARILFSFLLGNEAIRVGGGKIDVGGKTGEIVQSVIDVLSKMKEPTVEEFCCELVYSCG